MLIIFVCLQARKGTTLFSLLLGLCLLPQLVHNRDLRPIRDFLILYENRWNVYYIVAPDLEQIGFHFYYFQGNAQYSCCILKLPGKCWGNTLRVIIPIFTQMLDCCVRSGRLRFWKRDSEETIPSSGISGSCYF